jgi:peptidoglycan L-alanyl-D-glutamate endopeptidase CwlK
MIETLHPSIQVLARALLQRRPDLVMVSAFRSNEEQAVLFEQGRTTPGAIVTHAPAGRSWHNYGLAFDVAPRKGVFLDWANVGAAGRGVGLKWGGDFGDVPHFEYHPGLTIDDAIAGERPLVPAVPGKRRGRWGPIVGAAGVVLVGWWLLRRGGV